MRKLIALQHLSIDGVIQGPGGADEDTSFGFDRGGWIWPYGDEESGKVLSQMMHSPFDLVLGRKTYDIWAPFWPEHVDEWPEATKAHKYVASRTLKAGSWTPTTVLPDAVEGVKALKQQPGPDLHLWGSGDLLQSLFRADLVDTLWLMIYPIAVGKGKRLFERDTPQAEFRVAASQVTPKGVHLVTYERVRR